MANIADYGFTRLFNRVIIFVSTFADVVFPFIDVCFSLVAWVDFGFERCLTVELSWKGKKSLSKNNILICVQINGNLGFINNLHHISIINAFSYLAFTSVILTKRH